MNHEKETTVRYSDLIGMIPSITGKMELVYEGEQEGTSFVAQHLMGEATKTLFLNYFPKLEKLKKQDQKTPYDEVIQWFFNADSFELWDDANEETYTTALMSIQPLKDLLEKYQPNVAAIDTPFLMEFILWALVEFKQLSKRKTATGLSFNDVYDNLLNGL
jgi:magnesium chelatase subunit I